MILVTKTEIQDIQETLIKLIERNVPRIATSGKKRWHFSRAIKA